jgi:hypothetical protein
MITDLRDPQAAPHWPGLWIVFQQKSRAGLWSDPDVQANVDILNS